LIANENYYHLQYAGLVTLASIMPPITLATLQPRESATIVAIHADEALHQRLLALGFRSGKQVKLIRKARFSGPLQVRIGTTDILLRRNEAAKITVCKGAIGT
jgi:ferrous iron transport protein A